VQERPSGETDERVRTPPGNGRQESQRQEGEEVEDENGEEDKEGSKKEKVKND
jgi:hypothetical protein